MYASKIFLLALTTISTLTLAQVPAKETNIATKGSEAPAKSVDYNKKSVIAKGVTTISGANKSLIASNILCQNLPVVGDDKVAEMEAYSNYLFQVSDLFATNAKDIENHTIGINQDTQMSYTLVEPVSIVGIDFDVVNINRLKDIDGNYFQLTAVKSLTDQDIGKIKNIPSSNKLTVSTKDKKLAIICNIKLATKK